MSQDDCTHAFIDLYANGHWHCRGCPARGNYPESFQVSEAPKPTMKAILKEMLGYFVFHF